MTKYIALLRGINVGGHRKIKMYALKEMFRNRGFKGIATYIQSGNVVFEAAGEKPSGLALAIEKQIKETFGHEVPVIIRTTVELRRALKKYQFTEDNGWKGYISFLEKQPTAEQKKQLEALSSDIEKFRVIDKEIHSLIDKQTKKKLLFSNSFVEKQLKMHATTRNLRTVGKILELTAPT